MQALQHGTILQDQRTGERVVVWWDRWLDAVDFGHSVDFSLTDQGFQVRRAGMIYVGTTLR